MKVKPGDGVKVKPRDGVKVKPGGKCHMRYSCVFANTRAWQVQPERAHATLRLAIVEQELGLLADSDEASCHHFEKSARRLDAAFLLWACIPHVDMHPSCGHAFLMWTCIPHVDMHSFCGHAFLMWTCIPSVDMYPSCGHAFLMWTYRYTTLCEHAHHNYTHTYVGYASLT